MENAIIKLRKKHKGWGARDSEELLKREINVDEIPCESTINAILPRNSSKTNTTI